MQVEIRSKTNEASASAATERAKKPKTPAPDATAAPEAVASSSGMPAGDGGEQGLPMRPMRDPSML